VNHHPKNPSRDYWFPRSYFDRPDVAEYLDMAERSYATRLDDNAWSEYYGRGLSRIVRYVQDNSPFYAQALAGVDASRLSLGDLSRLPFTTKEDIRDQAGKILSKPVRNGAVYYETTGTTGRPLQTPRSWLESFASNYHFSRNMEHLVATRFASRPPIVGILGPTEVHSLGDGIGDVCRNADISHIKFWPYSPKIGFRRANELVAELGIDILFGTPAVILPMIRMAKETPDIYDAMREEVSMILTLGEVTSPAMRHNLGSLYGGAACQPGAYGGTELFVASSSCGHGQMHFAKQNYIAEILDPFTGEPVPDGKVGELVLTFLLPGIRPLIRYKTGDLVSVDRTPCECGSPGESLTNHGRRSDIIKLGDRHFFASALEEMIMEGVTGFFGYQITIDSVLGVDTMHVDLEPVWEKSTVGAVDQEIMRRLKREIGIPVTVATVDRLPPAVNTGGFITWKSARVNDKRVPTDAERAASLDLAARWLNGYGANLGNA
jgi:phenylacetate-CoA ligase